MRRSSRSAVLVALLLVTGWGALVAPVRTALAAPDRRNADAAREHSKKGSTLYQAGKYLEASVEFEEAYAVRPDAGLLYNAAQSARLGGDLRKAQTLYSSYVSFHPEGSNLGDAKAHLEKLEAAIKAEDEARRAAAASVTAKPSTTTAIEDTPALREPSVPKEQGPRRPVYKRWWFWTAIVGGAAVVATGVTLGVVLTRPAPAWSNVADLGPGAPATMNGLVQLRF